MSDNALQKLPSYEQLSKELSPAKQHEQYHTLMNTNPPEKWIKTNKFANNSQYIPIDKTEYLLDAIFGQWKIEVLSVGQLFNAVYTHVRLHYVDPVSSRYDEDGKLIEAVWAYHDGVGAAQIQVASGASAADLSKINNNAVQMALPMSKSYAIKDASDHLGRIFGRDLNRKDVMPFNSEMNDAFKAAQAEKMKSKFNKVNQE